LFLKRFKCSRARPVPRDRQAGFTLIELFIVLGLVVIMASLASPRMRDMIGRYRLNSASRHLLGHVQVARMLAISRNQEVRLYFVEVDSSPSSATTRGGLYRIERCASRDATGACKWEVVDDPLERTATSLNSARCDYAQVNNFCVDLVAEYRSVSIVDVGLPFSGRALLYGPDGFILNSIDEFAYDGNPTNIRVVLANKRADGMMEARIIRVDRAGNATLEPYVGSGLPSN